MKERREVMMIHKRECAVQPNVNCRVQSFGRIMETLSEQKTKWVKELGMGSLFFLRGKTLPRGLCYWLMTKVDPINRVFVAAPGCEYQLGKAQVSWVLGIPSGPRVLPIGAKGDRLKRFEEELYAKYGNGCDCGTEYFYMGGIMSVVEGECRDEVEFKTAFMALALCDVLCPTTCMRLSKELIPCLSIVHEAVKYDWCQLVLDWLMNYAERFARNFYKDGFARGCGGCTYFLAVSGCCL